MTDDLRDARREYDVNTLQRAQLPDEPSELFRRWMDDAVALPVKDATAMALATVSADGTPSVRIVLLKHFDSAGYCWYTDYRSQKGIELAANPKASGLFYWGDFDRQVRVTGAVVKLGRAESTAYFASRPTASRLAAAASQQSAPIAERATLLDRVDALRAQHPDGEVPAPADWGGYRLAPSAYEFWQGREGRLHDRFCYSRAGSGWRIERLQP